MDAPSLGETAPTQMRPAILVDGSSATPPEMARNSGGAEDEDPVGADVDAASPPPVDDARSPRLPMEEAAGAEPVAVAPPEPPAEEGSVAGCEAVAGPVE
mmetsp:Transcript_79663/g.223468  ORF Transcript_79663/g.223468 Transcript_79663/m.223468 type:complete len:100 (+) Transcript_79663:397-696(+)